MEQGLMGKPVTVFALCSAGWRGHSFYVYEAVPQEAEEFGGTSACREYQRSLFPLLQTSLKKKDASLQCNLF